MNRSITTTVIVNVTIASAIDRICIIELHIFQRDIRHVAQFNTSIINILQCASAGFCSARAVDRETPVCIPDGNTVCNRSRNIHRSKSYAQSSKSNGTIYKNGGTVGRVYSTCRIGIDSSVGI